MKQLDTLNIDTMHSNLMHSKPMHSKSMQSEAMQSKAVQSKAVQSKTVQSKAARFEATHLKESDIRLLNRVQNNFPVCPDPFSEIAKELDMDKMQLIERLKQLQTEGVISRFGGVINHKKVGFSTLAAMKVPEKKVDEVAFLINSLVEVNHNYLREHEFNLWFVITAKTSPRVDEVLAELKEQTGFPLINLPMVNSYHIDLAFKL